MEGLRGLAYALDGLIEFLQGRNRFGCVRRDFDNLLRPGALTQPYPEGAKRKVVPDPEPESKAAYCQDYGFHSINSPASSCTGSACLYQRSISAASALIGTSGTNSAMPCTMRSLSRLAAGLARA